MNINSYLSVLFKSCKEVPYDETSRLIFLSDSHRGDNSWADDFADNRNIFYHALNHYYQNNFTYIELGDGDELWKNKYFADIREAHSDIFKLLVKFHNDKRLYLIYGNHDKEREYPKVVRETLQKYFSRHKDDYEVFFADIKVHEALVLRNTNSGKEIFLLHGHQADIINDKLWWINMFLSRYLWRHLQLLGIKDPTSPAINRKRRRMIEQRLLQWTEATGKTIIAGHTHRCLFPRKHEPQYFNTGSCIQPRCITGIELCNNELSLIKWSISTNADGILHVHREVLEKPRKM